MIFDPLADLLTRLRNGEQARKEDVYVPYSKVKMAVCEVLKAHGYISYCEKVQDDNGLPEIRVTLKPNGQHVYQRVSKPGRRVYKKAQNIVKIRNGRGLAVYSTSQGIMSGKDAYFQGIG